MTTQGLCDVSPGDVLDKTNWEKAEGLLRDEIIGDKGFHHVHAGDHLIIDERSNHATVFRGPMPTDLWQYDIEMDENDFSLAGFQKFCIIQPLSLCMIRRRQA
jgi:hypothetical protein